MPAAHHDEDSSNPLLRKLRTARRLGFGRAAAMVADRVGDMILSNDVLVLASMTPAQLRPVEPLANGARIVITSNDPRQLLAAESAGDPLPASLRHALESSPPRVRALVARVDGEVAAWGFSIYPAARWPLSETGTTLPDRDDVTCFTEFETLVPFRGRRLQAALITHAAVERFGEGARIAYIWWKEDNIASRKNILRTGFVPCETHRRTRVLGIGRPLIQPVV